MGRCTQVSSCPCVPHSPWGGDGRRVGGQYHQAAGGLRVDRLSLSTWQDFSHGRGSIPSKLSPILTLWPGKGAPICFIYLVSHCTWTGSSFFPWSTQSPTRWNSCPHFPPQLISLPSHPLCSNHIGMVDKRECSWFQQNQPLFFLVLPDDRTCRQGSGSISQLTLESWFLQVIGFPWKQKSYLSNQPPKRIKNIYVYKLTPLGHSSCS